jgi:nucleoside permease NupC
MGWIVLFVVTVGIAWVANRRRRRTAWGTIGAALFSSLAFQVLAAWQLGYLDPFAPVAFLVSLLVTLPLSWAVGWLVWRGRGNSWRDHET